MLSKSKKKILLCSLNSYNDLIQLLSNNFNNNNKILNWKHIINKYSFLKFENNNNIKLFFNFLLILNLFELNHLLNLKDLKFDNLFKGYIIYGKNFYDKTNLIKFFQGFKYLIKYEYINLNILLKFKLLKNFNIIIILLKI